MNTMLQDRPAGFHHEPAHPVHQSQGGPPGRNLPGFWPWIWTCALLLWVGAGCRLVQSAADLPGQAVRVVLPGGNKDQTVDIVELQQHLMRFSDEFAASMFLATDKLRLGTNAPPPEQILRWKTGIADSAWGIATSPNTFANLLDMVTMVTLARMTVQDHWLPEVFGESARPMLEASQSAEREIWKIARAVLSTTQLDELRTAIKEYHATKPDPETVLFVRAYDFESRLRGKNKQRESEQGSVFSLLMIDPLAGLSPATQELAQTRLLGERTVFLAQRMPRVLRWQTELLALNTTQLPVVQKLVTNSTQFAASAERFAAAADKLPGQLRSEREQIVETLRSQEKELAGLAGEVRQTLLAGSQMSTSLNTTLTTFDALMQRFGVGETNRIGLGKSNTEAFRIRDYAETAAQLERTARQLTELLAAFDQTLGSTNLTQLSARFGPVVQQAQTGGKEVANYVFWRGVLFVGIVLVAALIYRFLAQRVITARSQSNSQ